jgi:HD-GYP domain-containing protein (c-di-GMP phosphodiesterase class II)
VIIEKDIYQLAVGSYVVDIAKQKGDFKIKSAGWIRDFKSIEFLVEKGVLRVKVDTSKHLDPQEAGDDDKEDVNTKAESCIEKEETVNRVKVETKQASFSQRLVSAKNTFDDAKQAQSKILDDIQQGKSIDPGPIKEITNQSIEAIFENPDALTCVLNIRNKDDYLLEHSVSVSILMSIFARYLKLDKTLIQDLAVGAFLHDVGKIKIPDEVLNKPGKLTKEEFEVIKTHAVHSKIIIDGTEGVADVSREVVANHHEKLNGQGYPRGLNQDSLSQYDRMISICDVFDALSAHRVYKKGIAQIRAFAILREMASLGHLDTALVDQFIHCLGIYPVGSLVRLSSNRLAIVDAPNPESPTKPRVKAFYSLTQNVFTAAKEIDLSSTIEETIEQGVRADDFNLDMNKITEFLLIEG